MAGRERTVRVGGRVARARPGDTVLQAALREGIPFPNACRVGGCGTCRCRLVEGEVRELTETAYLLTREELAAGTILACQSVPRTDVRVEVDLARRRPPEGFGGAGRQAPRGAPAGPLNYLKFSLFHAIALAAFATLVAGGAWTTAGLALILGAYVLGDAVAGDDTSTPAYRYPGILTVQLWLALPLLGLVVFASVWSVSPGDALGFGAWLSSLAGRDLVAARDATGPGHHVSGFVLTGLMIGLVGTVTAHELIHRTWDRTSSRVGRWLLAFSLDVSFAIEHVYGHHRYVATREDPATAPRGRSVYAHVVASTWKGHRSAWRIEAERLARRGRPVLSRHNAVLRGAAMSAALAAGAGFVGGWRGVAWFLGCALWGKALLEIVNYMEHYGLVRVPGTPVKPRHSWNTNRRISSWSMFNLTRHSHHHAQGEVPYHDLRPLPHEPRLVAGYLTTIVLTLVPPLWHALVVPRLLAWDRDFASPEERRLAAEANGRSGIAALRGAGAV